MMNCNAGTAADITLSQVLQENPYPTANTNSNDVSGLHHRGGQQLQSTQDESFTLSNNAKRQDDEHLKIIPFYILPCLSFGYGDSGRSNVKAACAIIFVPLLLLFFFLLDDLGQSLTKNMKVRSNINYLSGSTKSASLSQVQNLLFQRETLNVWPQIHRQVLVRQPEITLQIRGVDVEAMMKCPRGILFLFHGCSRYAASFYYSPQGRRIISTANEAGLITVAVEKNVELNCWDSQNDFNVVKGIATKFLKSRVKTCVNEQGEYYYPPVFGFGASSGGTFVEELASQMSTMRESFEPFVFDAVNIQIMTPTPGRRWDIPTVFTLMDGDERTKLVAEQSIPILQTSSQKGSAFQVLMTSGRKKITNLHFAYAFQDDSQMNPEMSNAIYRDLVGYGILDDNGALTDNPRNRKEDIDIIWQKYLNDRLEGSNSGTSHVTPFGVSKQLMQRLKKEELEDAHSIWLIEELNVAWDEHEITAEYFDEVITFFMDNVVRDSA